MGLIVLVALIGLLDAHLRGQRSAAARLKGTYKAGSDRWQAAHPGAVKSARWAGMLGALIHGTGPAIRAYRRDWREHYEAGKQRARARYARPEPQAAEPEPVTPVEPEVFEDEPTPEPEPAPAPAAPKPQTPFRPTVITGGLATTTPPKEAPVTTEITGIDSLHRAQEDVVARKQAELDDAGAALARAEGELVTARHIGEAAVQILNNDPAAAAAIAAQVEDAQQAVQAHTDRLAAADSQLAKAQRALALLVPHRNIAEAVGAAPQASSDTDVYRNQ